LFGVALALNLAALATAQTPPAASKPSAPAQAPSKNAGAAAEPLDKMPYRIRVLLAADPEARLDGARREALVGDWLTLVRRFVGAPWQVEVAGDGPSAPLTLGGELELLDPEAGDEVAVGVDKVWFIRVGAAGSGLVFTGREFDATTRRLGPLQRHEAPVARDAARVMFLFSLDLFAPYAVVGERFGKDVTLTVQGASLPAASEVGRVVAEGRVFQPLRVVPAKTKGENPIVREVPSTYLRVEAAEGPGARCSLVSAYKDPLTGRLVQKGTSLVALGVRPGKTPTRLRFQTLPDRAPAAGYVLSVRELPKGSPREVGMTDRDGRITLPGGFADGLVECRLVAGSSEPIIAFPLVPGESPDEKVIRDIDPKPLAVALETRLDSLRDAVIDLVAIRARLEARLKARFEGEDYDEAEAALKEFHALPPRDRFADELTRLKDEAARQQAQTQTAVLTKTAQAQLADLQALVDRYLDDEGFRAYADALEKVRAEASKPKSKAQAKAPVQPKAPPVASRPAPAPAAPAPPQPPAKKSVTAKPARGKVPF
jgi:hypothetical protein